MAVRYELRPLVSTKMALDIRSESQNNGAEAIIYAESGQNNQKFECTTLWTGDGYYAVKLIALHSGKALATPTSPQSGDAVGQWAYSDVDYCKWYMVPTGDDNVVVDGVSCSVVMLYPIANYALRLDCKSAFKDGVVRVCSEATDELDIYYQKWVLVPTTRYYADAPVPYDGGLSVAGDSTVYYLYDAVRSGVYPTFRVPTSWLSTNTYVWRYRKRDMSVNGIWGNWSDYSAWTAASASNTVRSGDRIWLGTALDSYYEFTSQDSSVVKAKHRQFEVQVCCAGYYTDGILYYGPAYTFILDICKRPTFVFSNPVCTPAGLGIVFSSDYAYGSNRLTLSSINGKKCNIVVDDLQANDTVLLPIDKVGWFNEGSTLSLSWFVGNDQHPKHGGERDTSGYSPQLTVSYDGGDITITPNITMDQYGVMTIQPKYNSYALTNSRVWVWTDRFIELPGSNGVFKGIAPQETFYVFILSHYGTYWGALMEQVVPTGVGSCHALITDAGKVIIIGLKRGQSISEEYTTSAIYESSALDDREFEEVRFATARKAEFSVEGSTIDGYSNFSDKDIEDLVGQYVTYRTPKGRIYKCAVLSSRGSAHNTWADISLQLKRVNTNV